MQSYLVFQLFISHFSTKKYKIYSRNSKEVSEESITHLSTTDRSFYLEVICLYDGKYELKFKGMCLKQNSMSFLYKNIIKSNITYQLDA